MKYDLGGGSLSSGNYSTATETACFDGVLFSVLRKRLNNDCGDFSFLFWCHLVEKAQQMAVAQTTCCRFQIQSSEQIEKSDANAICVLSFVFSRFPNKHVRAFFRSFKLPAKHMADEQVPQTNNWFQ